MRRREIVLGAGAALGGVPLSGCAAPSSDGPTPPAGTALADIHCHVFNGSDLPTIRFIKIVVLGHYPKQAIKTLDIDDPDVVDGLIALFTWIVGRTRAPSADDEIRVLDGQLKSSPQNLTDEANEEAVIDALASFAQPGGVAATGDQPTSGVRKVRRAIFKAAGENGVAAANKPLSNPEAKAVAGRAYRSKFDLGLLLRWFALFTRYRHVLVDKLAADHKRQKFGPALLCPALIDYDNWLGEKVTKSNLPAQVKVMGRISRRPTGPAVHGYVAFDPLRQVLFDRGVHTDFDPLGLARTALRDEGFMGVKLYPPMGFKASGNRDDRCQTYPDSLVFDKLLEGQPADAGTEGCSPRPADGSRLLSEQLDGAMDKLFSLCKSEDACILAHANDSNGANKGFSRRADPAFWIPVFDTHPDLRVCLAHFGHFEARSAAAATTATLPQASWEWTLGAFVKRKPDANVFGDISYLTEVFGKSPQDLAKYTTTVKQWLSTFDPDCRHLVFGTDWTMLGMEASYPIFSGGVHEYFKTQVGLDAARLQRLFFGNAIRFLGLRQGDKARARLEHFYDRHGLDKRRLPTIAA